MCSETLPAPTQPDEPPDVSTVNAAPCHTGPAALTCGFCASLLERSAGAA